jgi:hypothetical protein
VSAKKLKVRKRTHSFAYVQATLDAIGRGAAPEHIRYRVAQILLQLSRASIEQLIKVPMAAGGLEVVHDGSRIGLISYRSIQNRIEMRRQGKLSGSVRKRTAAA